MDSFHFSAVCQQPPPPNMHIKGVTSWLDGRKGANECELVELLVKHWVDFLGRGTFTSQMMAQWRLVGSSLELPKHSPTGRAVDLADSVVPKVWCFNLSTQSFLANLEMAEKSV
jgi:hypothetical protein